ncbi:MAG TPA: choice-of-anchor D domain-containing protein [Solirubrobacterales bacterium]|nr:choice-of-anchor D domain-containing protein [Solirubrobacterales bacterium]
MKKMPAPAKLLASGATVATALVLVSLVLPALALAAPQEGPGTVTIAPDPLVVPATTVGNQGEWLAVDVSYEGEGEAAIDKVSLLGEGAGEFSSNGSDCGILTSGQHCTAWFALKPTTLGTKEATLEVRFQGERPAELRPISGRSVPPQLSFSPASHDFGIQRVNRDSVGNSFQLTNTGEAPVSPNNFEISGDSDVFWTGSSDCWTLLAPGASCSMQVWFGPREVREYAAQLRVWANGEAFTAALSGRGGQAIVGPSTNPVDFGSAAVDSGGVVKTITLSNSGDLGAAYFIAVIAGGDAGSFQLLSESCTMVALMPTDSCSVRVRFDPDEPGPKSARFAMFGDGDDGVMVFLDGEGLAAAPAEAGPASGESAVASSRKGRRKRFGRNKGIHAPSAKAARRSELRAGAARR